MLGDVPIAKATTLIEKRNKHRDAQRIYYKNNKDKANRASVRWMKNNPEKVKQYKLKSRSKIDKVKAKNYNHCYQIQNKERLRKIAKKWREEHPENIRAMQKRCREKRRSTPKGKLNDNISCLIRQTIKKGSKKGRHWETLVGYTVDQLKVHIEKLFLEGMTWQNNGAWHIDHKRPISSFNFTSPEDIDFKKCWELSNLQPLWAEDNLKKHKRFFKADKLNNECHEIEPAGFARDIEEIKDLPF
jgi:hypothetical protein